MQLLIILVLLVGCAETSEEGWPRTAIMRSAVETDEEIAQVELVRAGMDEINFAVGAAVYQLAVTLEVPRTDLLVLEWVKDFERPGRYFPGSKPRIVFRSNTMEDGSRAADITAVIHELMHHLGVGHDEDPGSVMQKKWHCYARATSLNTCPTDDVVHIKPAHVAVIREAMSL